MNIVSGILKDSLTYRIGWALVHSLWQGAIAAGCLKLLRYSMRRHSANSRYLAGCLLLFVTALAPLITFMYEPGNFFQFLPTHSPGLGTFSEASSVGRTNAAGFMGMRLGTSGFVEHLFPWLVFVWSVGVFISFLGLLKGYFRLGSLKKVYTENGLHPGWLEILEDLKCCLNISRPVRLLQSSLIEVPMVIGWLSPVILLPASSLVGLTPAQLEAILAHELAHIHRHDYLVNAFQAMVETLMFYHPAVWWISSCIREEREHCCDDWVTRICEDRLTYARALTRLEELRANTPRLALAATTAPLLRRIRRLVGAPANEQPVTLKEIAGIAMAFIGLILFLSGFSLLLITPAYEAVARLRIDQENPTQLAATDSTFGLNYDPYFVQTEVFVICSDAILNRVIASLKLDEKWADRYGGGQKLVPLRLLALLRDKIKVRPIRSTSLIEIRVASDRPEEAASIANSTAAEYLNYRHGQTNSKIREGIEQLEHRFKQHEREIEEAQKKVNELREKLNLSPEAAAADSPAALISSETLRTLESQRIETKTELVKQEILLKSLRQLTPEQLIEWIPRMNLDPQINNLLESRNMAELDLVGKTNQFGAQNIYD